MQHSLQAYLERQPTEKLETLVQNYFSGNASEDYRYAIPMMIEILDLRAKQ